MILRVQVFLMMPPFTQAEKQNQRESIRPDGGKDTSTQKKARSIVLGAEVVCIVFQLTWNIK